MSKISKTMPEQESAKTLGKLLRSLPDNARAEVIEAFDLFTRADGPGLGPHLFYELVEQAPVAVSITDRRAEILYVNPAFESLTGYAAVDVLGKNESILSNNATPRCLYQTLWDTIQSKQTWSGSLINRRKSGEAYLAELTISPVLDREGEISNFLGMHRDITEVHRLNREVKYQKGLFETVLDAAPVCVALVDANLRVILDNQEYKKLLGDLRGAQPAGLLLQALEEQADIPVYGSGGSKSGFSGIEVRLDVSGGRGPRWFSVSGTWVADPDSTADGYFRPAADRGACLLLLAQEITARRRETERARFAHLRATLAEQQRLSGMREALAAATYQIQQPLNLVNAAINMLQRGKGAGANLLPVLTQIAESAEQAYQALRTALPPETEEEPRQSVNLNEILQEVLQLNTEHLLAGGIVVEWLPQTVLPVLSAHPRALRSLFMNLIDNAIQAVTEGSGSQREIRLTTAERAELLEVEIQDNGIGLAEERQLAVFEPLYCGWQQKTGHAGMGLSMAQEIACRHGGEIRVDSRPGTGCRVVVTLPLNAD